MPTVRVMEDHMYRYAIDTANVTVLTGATYLRHGRRAVRGWDRPWGRLKFFKNFRPNHRVSWVDA